MSGINAILKDEDDGPKWLFDASPVIPVCEIGDLTDPRWWARDLYRIARAWNIRRAKIAAYQHGVEFGRADRPDRPDSSTKGDSFEDLDSIMAESIRAALVRHGGNRSRAANEVTTTVTVDTFTPGIVGQGNADMTIKAGASTFSLGMK